MSIEERTEAARPVENEKNQKEKGDLRKLLSDQRAELQSQKLVSPFDYLANPMPSSATPPTPSKDGACSTAVVSSAAVQTVAQEPQDVRPFVFQAPPLHVKETLELALRVLEKAKQLGRGMTSEETVLAKKIGSFAS